MKLTEYRECIKNNKPHCPYVVKSPSGCWCCSIDDYELAFYGCVPINIIAKVEKQEKI